MNINLNAFAQSLLDAEEGRIFVPPQVSAYVLRHIYEPLLRDESVCFSQLDFTAFDENDLSDLGILLEACASTESRLLHLNTTLCRAAPVSAPKRTFC